MWRIAIIAAASLIGAASLSLAADENAQSDASVEGAKTTAAASSAGARERAQVRLCLGPARVTLGGRPMARLAFGGEGCTRRPVKLLGVRVFRSGSATGSARSATTL